MLNLSDLTWFQTQTEIEITKTRALLIGAVNSDVRDLFYNLHISEMTGYLAGMLDRRDRIREALRELEK